jgi:filamentous hemagglutinin family protein
MVCTTRSGNKVFAKAGLWVAISLAYAHAQTTPAPTQLPQGGKVVGGSAAISSSGNTLTVQQSSQRAAIDWNTFNVGSGAQVNFNQPNAAAVTLNRVLDNNPSQIMGRINAPGQVFFVNPNGVLFGATSQVDVGGLLVTTHGISNADFMAGKSTFEGNGKSASVINQGSLQAALGGYIALLAPQVRNEGVIIAREGTVAMAGGNKTTLVFSGQSLTAVQIDQGVMDALVENKHVVKADGGLVVMTARSASVLMGSLVRNSGTLQAQTIANKGGRIMLMGDMTSGTTEVGGTLDASAPNGGDGGFIETSAGRVKIADEVRITTLAAQGKTGQWLVDPVDFTVASSGGDMTNTALQTSLATTNVELQSAAGATEGSGDININDDVSWTANTTLTLTASNNVNVNANLSATGDTAGLVIQPNTTHTSGTNTGLSATMPGTTGVTQPATGTGEFNLQTGKEIVLTGTQATVVGADQAYVKVTTGQSTYGSTPSVSYKLFDQASGGNDITANFSLSGSPVWSSNVTNATSVGTYTISYQSGLSLNRNFVTRFISSSNWSVTPKAIYYGGLSVQSKVYDGTTTPDMTGTPTLTSKALGTGSSSDGLYIAGDTLSLTGTAVGVYNSKDVESASFVTFSGLSLTGSSSANYFLLQQPAFNASITPKSISLTGLTVQTKVYDGTTTAKFTGTPTLSGNVTGDTVSVSGTAVGTYNSKDVTSASFVYISGLTLGGASSGNYYLPSGLSGTITSKSISVTGLSVPTSKVYDGTTTATVTGTQTLTSKVAGTGTDIDGSYISGDTVSLTGTAVGTYNNKNVASASSVTFSGLSLTGDSSSNYSLTQQTSSAATITRKTVSATGLTVTSSKVYDGTTSATVTGTAGVTSIALGSGTSSDGLYFVGDTLTVSGTAVGSYNSKNVLDASTISISGLTLGGSSSGNYSLSTSVQGSISTKYLTISSNPISVPSSKVYDGTTAAVISGTPTLSSTTLSAGTSSDGLYFVGDTVSLTGSPVATYNSKDVSSASLVSISLAGLSLTGDSSSNYSLLQPPTMDVSATITAKSLSVGLTVPSTKVYDGTTSAVLSGTPALTSKASGTGTSIDGFYITGDTVSVSGTAVGTYNSKDVTSASSVSISGLTLGGDSSANYSLTSSLNATITAKSISVTGLSVPTSKVYDGTTAATVTGTPTLTPVAADLGSATDGLYISGDTVSLSGTAVGTYNNKNVASATSVSFSGLSLTGSSSSNYSLTPQTSSAATITAKTVSATGLTVTSSKVYDGTTSATVTGTASLTSKASSSATSSDGFYITGDTLTVSGTAVGSYNSKNVLDASTISISGLTLGGTSSGNYSLSTSFQGSISTKSLTMLTSSLSLPSSKVYDGTTTAVISGAPSLTSKALGAGNSSDGLYFVTDAVNLTGSPVATYNSKDVSSASLVTISLAGLSLGGDNSSNYSLAQLPTYTASATITPKSIAVSGLGTPTKVYDGTTTAVISNTPSLNSIAAGTGSSSDGLYITGDTLSISGTPVGTYNSKDVTSANTVTVSGYSLSGASVSNYSLPSTILSGSVTAKTLTGTVTAPNKPYDGTTTATPTVSITSGLIGTETVTATGTATFNTKDVLTANTVTLNTVTLADGINGGLASNYSLPTGIFTNASINAKALSATVTATKTYDGATTATPTVSITSGFIGTETVTATGTGTLNSKDVLTATTVTVNTVSLADGINGGLASNYSIDSTLTGQASITPVTLSATITAPNKTYDGTTTATPTVSITSGLIGTETVTATGTATFNTKDVLTANTVTLDSFTLADGDNGGLLSNYTLPTGIFTNASINAKALSASVTATKTYDGATTATPTVSITSGFIGTETVTATGTGTLNFKDVSTATTVTLNANALTLADGINGGLASNYSLASGLTGSGSVTAKTLTGTVTAPNKPYDGTTTATPTVSITSGLIGSETVTATGTAAFNSKDVLTADTVTLNTVTLADGINGGLASNYSLPTGIFTNATINAKALSATITAPNKTYDGTTTATPTVSITSGLIGSETVTATGTAAFNSKDVLTADTVTLNTVTLADGINGGLASNYSLPTGIFTNASINAKALSASVTATKTYDGATTATPTVSITSGFIGTETVTATGTATFNSKDVLTATTVTVNTVSLADGDNGGLASNYSLASGLTGSGSITAKTLTGTVSAPSKTYDGTTTATPTVSITSGLIGTETVTATGTATFNTKDVLTANTVTLDSFTLADGDNGGLLSNYTLPTGIFTNASINAKALSASVTATKTYDGATTATPTVSITSGFIGTETVTATGTGTLNFKDVSTATTVTLNTVTLADGINGGLASNYSLASGLTGSGSVTAKTLTGTVTAPNKPYDGTTTATPTVSITSGLIGSETVTATGTAAFNSKDVLTADTVTLNTVTLADGINGGLASNYSLPTGIFTNATINAKALSATITAPNKPYDGTTTATPTVSITSGLIGSETVTATGTAAFNSKDVLTADTVTLNTVTLADGINGGLASNYSLPTGIFTNASINAKALSASVTATKTYDGATTATPTVSITSGFIGTETVTATGTATFNSKDVLTATTVTVNTVSLADGDNGGLASNYSLASGLTGSGSITAKTLTGTVSAPSKTYDGTTTATPTVSITSGLIGTETVTATGTATFNSKDVLTAETVTLNTVTLADGINGGLASNYSLPTGIFTNASINAKALSASVTATKTYDGATTATPTVSITSGFIGTETVTATGTGTLNFKDVSTATTVTLNTVTLADGINGGLASNYSLASGLTGSGSVTAKTLTGTVTAPNKPYDGTTTATPTVSITSGLIGSETVTATGTAAFNSKDVLTADTVTLNTVTLADGINGGLASNYSLPTGIFTNATINAKALSATITAPNKTYDGTTTATPTVSITSGLIGSETVTATGTAAFNSKDVLTADTVTLNTVTLADGINGGLASNYSLPTGIFTNASINAKALSATVTAPNKVYDGNKTATPSVTVTAGLIGTETVLVESASAQFANTSVGNAKNFTVTSSKLQNGTNGGLASNYVLVSPITGKADITFPTYVKTPLELTGVQLAIMPVSVIAALTLDEIRNLSTDQIRGLTRDQLLALSSRQLATLSVSQFAVMTQEQLNALTNDVLSKSNDNNLSASIATLPLDPLVSAAKAARINSLTNAGLTVLSNTQISQLNPTQLKAISPEYFSTLSPVQIAGLTIGQFQLLSSSQLRTLSTAHMTALTKEQLQVLSISQLNALTPTQVSAMKLSQIEALSSVQLISLSEAQIASLNPPQLTAFLPSTLSKLRESQLQALTGNQIAALSNAQLASLNNSQLQCLSCNQFKALSGQQIAELPPAVFKALVSNKMTCMKPQQLAALSKGQMAMLATHQITQLTSEQLQAFNNDQLNVLSAAQIQRLKPEQVQTLLPSQVATLSNDQLLVVLKLLTPEQIQALTPQQIAALTPEFVAQLNRNLSPTLTPDIQPTAAQQVSLLSQAQISTWTKKQINALDIAQLQSMLPEQIAAISPNVLSGLDSKFLQNLLPRQAASFTPAQLQTLTPAQVQLLRPAVVTLLSPQQVKALSVQQIALLQSDQLQALSPKQLQAMAAEQVANLNPRQVAALSPVQMSALTPEHIRVLKTPQLQSLSQSQINGLLSNQIAALTPEQISVLRTEQILVLSPLQVTALSPAQFSALQGKQLRALQESQVAVLNFAQLAALTPAQMQAFTPNQIVALTPSLFGLFSKPQIEALTLTQFKVLPPLAIAAMGEAQLIVLSPAQMAAINAQQLAALSAAQLQVFTAAQIAAINPSQLVALSNTQLQSISPQQIGQLNAQQLRTVLRLLNPNQLTGLTPTQVASMDINQLRALSPQQLQTLADRKMITLTSAVR